MSCFFVIRLFLVATLLFLAAVFRLTFALGLDIFIPGMFCMSWPWAATLGLDVSIRPMIMTALNPDIRMKARRFNLFMVPPLDLLATAKTTRLRNAHNKKAHLRANELATIFKGELDSKNADENMAGEGIARWPVLRRHDRNGKT